jgi:RNA polymerase sigma factor (sigma-70 family)
MVGNQSAGVLGRLGTLFDSGTVGSLGDASLLERFSSRREEAAFASLVERHGPMVLSVCQQVLGDPHDAQDAFQVVFLILAQRAGSIRRQGSVASWLHGVALRVAAKARLAAARRRAHERRAGEISAKRIGEQARPDANYWPEVHEELGQLPEKYRAPLLLCDLEGLTQQMAARHLDWPLGTLQSRLARGRVELRARLTRRGVGAPAGLMHAGLLTQPAIIPTALANLTVRTGVLLAIGEPISPALLSASVVALAKAGAKAMNMTRLARVAVAVSTVGLAVSVVTFIGLNAHSAAGARGMAKPAQQAPISDSSPDSSSRKGDLARFQGKWTTTKVDGHPKLGDAVFVWEIKDRALTITRKGPKDEMSRSTIELKLHETDTPRWLELTKGHAPDGKPSPDVRSIYELNGDTLKICSSIGIGDTLPKVFKAGDGNLLLIFQRGPGKDGAAVSSKAVAASKAANPDTLPEPKGDLARLQGEWMSEAGTSKDTTLTIEIRGSKLTMIRTGPQQSLHRDRAQSFRIDEKATPKKHLDFSELDALPERKELGIYELEEETLKIAIGGPGDPRPTQFRSGEGDKAPHLLILKRKQISRPPGGADR